ncbi:MAG TPA: N-acetyl-D-Glu racemase DgcA [Afifellaceae bacterium]|nr:N-acetyl-D-Glu racemase DgcA [Afifellaceae bacterium]
MTLRVSAQIERWPIAGSFVISRGARTEAVVVVAEVSDGRYSGRGECVPYPRYGETPESVLTEIELVELGATPDREALRRGMPPGAARNALDCALWDLEAKRAGQPVHALMGVAQPHALTTAYTLSLGDPTAMAQAARKVAARPLLKIKLGGDGDADRIRAVREAVPAARLIADANEGWNEANFAENMRACAEAGVALLEQPLPAGRDDLLLEASRPLPVCADESVHVAADLAGLAGKYDAVNIKLDKAGGLTEALLLKEAARAAGYRVMVGCMVGTSLAMSPAMLLAQDADFVDLDGPLLLARDRAVPLAYTGSTVAPPPPELWG